MAFKCDQCDRKDFKTAQGLAVHKYRAHSKAGKSWNNKKKPKLKTEDPVAAILKEHPLPPAPIEVAMAFCPCCGHNLEAHARAYAAVVRAQP